MLEHTKRQVKVLFLCRSRKEFIFPFVSHRILLFVSSYPIYMLVFLVLGLTQIQRSYG